MPKRNLYITVVGMLFATLQGWFFIAVPLLLYFTFYYSAAWVVPVALLIDGYFGALYTFPKLTVFTLVWFIVSELIKPHLLWQNSRYE
jgi:hypothetical protein